MDKYSSRRTTGRFEISRKSSSLVLGDSAENNTDRNFHVHSRVECSSSDSRLNLNPAKSTQIESPTNSKTSKPYFSSSSNGKEIIGSSSRTNLPSVNTSRKSFSDQKKKSPAYSSCVNPEPHDHELYELGRSGPSNRQKFRWARQDNSQASSSSSSSSSSSFARNSSYKIGEPESSTASAKGKKISGLTLDDRKNNRCNFNRGISISDHSRRTRKLNSFEESDEDATSVRAHRSNRNLRLPTIECQPENISLEEQFATRNPTIGRSSENPRANRSDSLYEPRFGRSFMNRNTFRQFNLDGIAEMLLAFERIGQEEETSYEQLLVLETNLLLGGVSFHDQHRDMRLDIDNMSYEELLALEEKMGSVSILVPEEDLRKCIRKEIFEGDTDCTRDEDDFKCCICQEEYAEEEEIGRLRCDHRYHVHCIRQWLSLKYWCPICKVSAGPK